MLRAHLDPNSDLASRRPSLIDAEISWLDKTLGFQGKKICDLGCGPGLYASRMQQRGAEVTGLDLSETALAYAIGEARREGRRITYLRADYTRDDLPGDFDVFTLIGCDFCVLSPSQRQTLVRSIRDRLRDGGQLVLDVHSLRDFERVREGDVVEFRLMEGFWASSDYVGLKRTTRYEAEKVSLDRYLIIEPARTWEIYNWLQYFSPEALEQELSEAGFRIVHRAGSLSGDPLLPTSRILGVIAQAI
jgi:SAM-dependent methyltransferase